MLCQGSITPWFITATINSSLNEQMSRFGINVSSSRKGTSLHFGDSCTRPLLLCMVFLLTLGTSLSHSLTLRTSCLSQFQYQHIWHSAAFWGLVYLTNTEPCSIPLMYGLSIHFPCQSVLFIHSPYQFSVSIPTSTCFLLGYLVRSMVCHLVQQNLELKCCSWHWCIKSRITEKHQISKDTQKVESKDRQIMNQKHEKSP